MLDLADKDLKAVIINMFKELKKNTVSMTQGKYDDNDFKNRENQHKNINYKKEPKEK